MTQKNKGWLTTLCWILCFNDFAHIIMSDLPPVFTLAVSVEVERIGNKGSSGDIARIITIFSKYDAYSNNLAKILLAIKNMCVREGAWIARMYLQYKMSQIIVNSLKKHSGSPNFVSRACEVISTFCYLLKKSAADELTENGIVTALTEYVKVTYTKTFVWIFVVQINITSSNSLFSHIFAEDQSISLQKKHPQSLEFFNVLVTLQLTQLRYTFVFFESTLFR